MSLLSRRKQDREQESFATKAGRRLTSLQFLLRYPILLLAFGPPEFKEGTTNVDTSQAHADFWNFIQVGWLFLIATRAIYRLVSNRKIRLPRPTRSVLILAFSLVTLFLISIAYSPGRAVSAEYLTLFVLTLICVIEFLVDVYQNPPDWIRFLLELRSICLVLVCVVIAVLPFEPTWVLGVVEGHGFRLLGGQVGSMDVMCPIIAIVSAYCFLHKLESKTKSLWLTFLGIVGLLSTQVRGAELGVLVVMIVLGREWAKANRRLAFLLMSVFASLFLLVVLVIAAVGPDRIWSVIARGQDTEQVLSASGRTDQWSAVAQYCIDHPQGLGYISGIRHAHLGRFAMGTHLELNEVGGTDSSYVEVLGDAGWLAFFIYLLMLGKVAAVGWRFSRDRSLTRVKYEVNMRHTLKCALLLFLFCAIEQFENSDFALPLRQAFYAQYILFAIILGASGNVLAVSRARYTASRLQLAEAQRANANALGSTT
jgi:O-antigen ligase